MPVRTRAIGIRRMRAGWQAYVYAGGRTHTQQFAITTPLETMQAWRRTTAGAHTAPPRVRTGPTSLAASLVAYERIRHGMPTLSERMHQLRVWADVLGPLRDRSTVTRLEVETHLRAMAAQGYAPQTVRHYRTALRHLYVVLDGVDAPNPARRAWVPPVPAPAVRTLTPDQVVRLLGQVQSPLLHARLSLMWTTGLPPALIKQIDPATDIDVAHARLRVQPRRKGAGTTETWLPVDAAALDACQAMTDVGGWGTADWNNLRRDTLAAARRAGLSHVRPYDLRHARGALLYAVSGDLATVSRLLLHASLATTRRYAAAAAASVDAATVAKAGAKVAQTLRADSAREDGSGPSVRQKS